ncbi:MAG: acyl-CoA carboxylase subunit epsilon [Actinomycetota bacterium]|nr:acyl-CoA carboxylase subunit epsilon [Actinomycetota bacterium]
MTKPLDFKVLRGNPTADEIAVIHVVLQIAKNSSEELGKQKKRISNWNSPAFRFRNTPHLNSGWQYSYLPGA